MKIRLFIVALFLLIFFNCKSYNYQVYTENKKYGISNSLLWNPKITKKSWVFYNQDSAMFRNYYSNLTEGHLLGSPSNQWDSSYLDPISNQTIHTSNLSNYSLMWVTLGYDYNQKKSNPGFDFLILNDNRISNNEPLEFRIINNAKFLNNDKLREVGFIFNNWPQYWPVDNVWSGGNHSFKANYNINDFNTLKVTFNAKLNDYKPPLNNTVWSGAYITCDFRFSVYNDNGSIFKSYLIGVIFSNPSNKDYNGNPNDDIFFQETILNQGVTIERTLLHGNKVGIDNIDSSYKNITIDFKPLILKYFNDIDFNKTNFITGLDIYSATRSADITYDIKEIDFEGN
ncbi:hypothetical protein [Empedobacter stercoris]|uniref:hypothetical protein n=1 Tax=Empedobacter stercoris TaxID=1628248 RepID=UPI0039EA9F0D